MKRVLSIFFAFLMIVSVVFISDDFSAQAQTRKGSVAVKKKKNGIASRTYRGGKYVYRKGKNGVVYIYRKSSKGLVYVGKKTYKGTKYVGKKTYKGTKYVGKKTYKGSRMVVSRTKKIVQ